MTDATIELPDGRTLGYADYGNPGDTAVLWCHGGPGSRLEAKPAGPVLASKGLRVVGIDRPGYGLSTPRPGRSIESCVPDILAVADAIGADEFYVVGVSTGGAYATATAAVAPERVRGAVLACALSDMRNEAAKKAMVATTPELGVIWNSATRDEALEAAMEQFGDSGTKLFGGSAELQETAAERGISGHDAEMFSDPAFLAAMLEALPPMFAWGMQGYTDDRIADGAGWGGFDVSAVRCPVIVAHGDADAIVPVETAHVTAETIPGAQLRIFERDGHFSIVRHIPALLEELTS